MSSNPAALAYHEPGIVTVLVLSSFLLLLNVVNYALDRIVYCGLVGQIFIGIGWGLPGAGWLSREAQDTVMQLGYLGLILIVYEGGISTNLKTLRANLFLSAAVALIGITAPIGLSYVLQGLLPITAVQAFAAGAALCSTSLGTTFTVLSTSGLTESRLGIVLSSAAMMDDVVGLIMVQVISNLGQDSNFSAITVVRPILVSLAFAVLVPLLCIWAIKPIVRQLQAIISNSKNNSLAALLASEKAALVFHTAILLAMVAGSTYAGTSNLFAAYLAGAAVTWSDSLRQNMPSASSRSSTVAQANPSPITAGLTASLSNNDHSQSDTVREEVSSASISSKSVFETYYLPAVALVLKPFFFASIGFSIPITQMFSGAVVWRGFVYAALMTIGKLLCGVALIRFAKFPSITPKSWKPCQETPWKARLGRKAAKATQTLNSGNQQQSISLEAVSRSQTGQPQLARSSSEQRAQRKPTGLASTAPTAPTPPTANSSRKRVAPPKPRSLYPAAMLGCAMVARGEIGFLVSSIVESNAIFGSDTNGGSSELFLVVTWAILICTLLGPVSVGLMVRRVKRLQAMERGKGSGREDPLGVWGIEANKS